ncbi:hypothetical protein [Hyalangium minutum]
METELFGGGRVPKDDERVDAYGRVGRAERHLKAHMPQRGY